MYIQSFASFIHWLYFFDTFIISFIVTMQSSFDFSNCLFISDDM